MRIRGHRSWFVKGASPRIRMTVRSHRKEVNVNESVVKVCQNGFTETSTEISPAKPRPTPLTCTTHERHGVRKCREANSWVQQKQPKSAWYPAFLVGPAPWGASSSFHSSNRLCSSRLKAWEHRLMSKGLGF